MTTSITARDDTPLDDAQLVACVLAGQRDAFRHITQRCNQRMYRVVRSVLHDDIEAEDVVQEAYVRAYEMLASFRGEASLATWLTRIALNEAYGRLRRRQDTVGIDTIDAQPRTLARVIPFPGVAQADDPLDAAVRAKLRRALEHAVDALPEAFRLVYVLRDVEGCTAEETAAALGVLEETVKTRLHRARRLLRNALHEQVTAGAADAFSFLGARCARITEAVMVRISALSI